MLDALGRFEHKVRFKIFCLFLGLSAGSGMMVLGQGCLGTGQCAACSACVSRLSILTIPVLLEGAAMLVGKVWGRGGRPNPPVASKG